MATVTDYIAKVVIQCIFKTKENPRTKGFMKYTLRK